MNNQITLIGRVGKNPELRTFKDSDNKLVRFSLAVNQYSSKKEEKPATMWIDIECWNAQAERVMQTVLKGREIVVNGRLVINEYLKEGSGFRVVMKNPVVRLTGFHLCGPKLKGEEEGRAVKEVAANKRKPAA